MYRVTVITIVAALAATTTYRACANELIYEQWIGGWGTGNRPLDGDQHLMDSRVAVALNIDTFVSPNAFTISRGGWAFTFESSTPWTYWNLSDSEIAPDLEFKYNSNPGGGSRIVVANLPGGQYAVSDDVYAYWDTNWENFDTATVNELASLPWRSFDPATFSTGASVTPDFSRIYELGFAGNGANYNSRIDDIVVRGTAGRSVGDERWATWPSGNQPLDGDAHLTDPRLAVGLNRATEVSPNGFTYSQGEWAFTLKSSAAWMYWDLSDSAMAPDLEFKYNSNPGGGSRLLIADIPGRYAVSENVYDYWADDWGIFDAATVNDLASLNWLAFDPATFSTGDSVTPNFSRIYELGFAGNGANQRSRIDDIVIRGTGNYCVADEGWAMWDSGNQPLDGDAHLTDPRLAVGLNRATEVSPNGFTYSQGEWAFTLKSSADLTYWDLSDSEIAPDLEFKYNSNTGGGSHILISHLPGQYLVSDDVYAYWGSGWGDFEAATIEDLASLNWSSFDPVTFSTGASVTPDFSRIYELGFAGNGANQRSRIDDIAVRGTGVQLLGAADEQWAKWNSDDPGRQANEPLDAQRHLTDPRLTIGLNQSTGVSSNGFTYSQGDWAFTLRPSTPWMFWDFTDDAETPHLQFDENSSPGGGFRILIANLAGDEYAVSDDVYDHWGGQWQNFGSATVEDLRLLDWLSFDPTNFTIGGSVVPDFSRIYELGFARDGATGYSRIDNILIRAMAVPEPSSAGLLAAGVLGLLATASRRRTRRSGP